MYDSKPNWEGTTIPGLEGIQQRKANAQKALAGLGDSTGTAPWSSPTGPDASVPNIDLSSIISWIQANPWILIVGIGLAWAMFSGTGSGNDPFKEYKDEPAPRRAR